MIWLIIGCWFLCLVGLGWLLFRQYRWSRRHSRKNCRVRSIEKLELIRYPKKFYWLYGGFIFTTFCIGLFVSGSSFWGIAQLQKILFRPAGAWLFKVPDFALIFLAALGLIIGISVSALFKNFIIQRYRFFGRFILRKRRMQEFKGQILTTLETRSFWVFLALSIFIFLALPCYYAVTPEGIHDNHFYSVLEKNYTWDQVAVVKVYAKPGLRRSSLDTGYILTFTDGSNFDLLSDRLPLEYLININQMLISKNISFEITQPDFQTITIMRLIYPQEELEQIQSVFQTLIERGTIK